MARRPWTFTKERDVVPYVTRTETHRALVNAVEERPDQPVLVRGRQAGSGVTRTLEEFAQLLETSRFRHNVACRHVTVDFFAMSYRPVPLILQSLRNQIVELANVNKVQAPAGYFSDFDTALKGWYILYYLPGFKKPDLEPSDRVKKARAAAKVLQKLTIGATTGLAVGFEEVNQLLNQMAQEGAESVSEASMNRAGQKMARWLDKRIEQSSRRAVRAIRKPTNGKVSHKDFEAAMLVFFTEAAIDLQNNIADDLRIVFNFDSLDEYEADRDHETNVRGSMCSIMQGMTPTPSCVALGTRGTPTLWMEEMSTIDYVSSPLGMLTKQKVEEAWITSKESDRVRKTIARAFPDGREEILAADLADLWRQNA